MKNLPTWMSVVWLTGSTFCFLSSTAQEKNAAPEKRDFKQMQREFHQQKKQENFLKTKGWKRYKRWEEEMVKHTDGTGNPPAASVFLNEAVRVAESRASGNQRQMAADVWVPFGPVALPDNQTGYMENGIGRVNCVAFHPSDVNTYFAGVAQGGLWKTTDAGLNWQPLTDQLPITRISDIAIHPTTPSTMYISLCDFEYVDIGLYLDGRKRNTHYGLGVYKTTDGGQTWNPTGLTFQLMDEDASLIRKILIHPLNPNVLLAAGTSGMYRSTDDGQSWTKTLDSLCWDLVQDPTMPNVVYAASGWLKSANVGSAAVYKSTDFGTTWTVLNTGIPATGQVQRVKIAVAPSDNNYVYVITVNTQGGLYDVYKSTDAGLNFQKMNLSFNFLGYGSGSTTSGQGNYDLAWKVDATDKNRIYAGGILVYESLDGAQTFNPVTNWVLDNGPTIHCDIHDIQQHPITGDVFVTSDGGFYRTAEVVSQTWASADGGSNWPTIWSKLNHNIQITSFYRLSSNRNATNERVVAGAQDNATFFYNGTSWATIFGGDGMDNYLDPANPDHVIGSSQYGSFYDSWDGGISTNWSNPNINNENAEWTSPIVADYNNPGHLYAGFENVVVSYDNGASWADLTHFPPTSVNYNAEISDIAISNSNSNTIYVTKRLRFEHGVPGKAYKTNDGGVTWTDITAGLPDSLFFTSVEISETNSDTAYVSVAGLVPGVKVFKTTNGGQTWQNISYDLPNAPANRIKYFPGTGKMVLATDFGVYMLDPNATSWQDISNGLPNVIVSDLEFNNPKQKLYISTFGRGIWTADYSSIVGVKEKNQEASLFAVYPTLSNGLVQLDWKGQETVDVVCIDIMGREVWRKNGIEFGKTSVQLDLPNGLYYVKAMQANASYVQRLILQGK